MKMFCQDLPIDTPPQQTIPTPVQSPKTHQAAVSPTESTGENENYSRGVSLQDAYGIQATVQNFEKPKAIQIKTTHFEFSGNAQAPDYILKHVNTTLEQLDMIVEHALDVGDGNLSTTHFHCKGLRSISPMFSDVMKTMIQSLEELVVKSTTKDNVKPWVQSATLYQS
jgi:hypothetical protein